MAAPVAASKLHRWRPLRPTTGPGLAHFRTPAPPQFGPSKLAAPLIYDAAYVPQGIAGCAPATGRRVHVAYPATGCTRPQRFRTFPQSPMATPIEAR